MSPEARQERRETDTFLSSLVPIQICSLSFGCPHLENINVKSD